MDKAGPDNQFNSKKTAHNMISALHKALTHPR